MNHQIVSAQEWSPLQADQSFSSKLSGGMQYIPLLRSPDSRQQQRNLMERSIGGIAGSSFQTEEVTPDQIFRQHEKFGGGSLFAQSATAAPDMQIHIFQMPELSELQSFRNRIGTGYDTGFSLPGLPDSGSFSASSWMKIGNSRSRRTPILLDGLAPQL